MYCGGGSGGGDGGGDGGGGSVDDTVLKRETNKDDRHMLHACNSLGRRVSQSISWSDFLTFIFLNESNRVRTTDAFWRTARVIVFETSFE